jgi:Tfp pilus assembly PilM family ATPase
LYLATRHQGQRALLYIPRALEQTVRQLVHNGRSLSQQFQDLHQLQLDQLLQRKEQLAEQRAKTKTERPDRPP